jgi:ribonuclease HIII
LNRIIGVDESGKGDFFGPLVVGGMLIPDSVIPELVTLGVRDSKLISDGRVLELDAILRNRYPHSLAILLPRDYNSVYQSIRNLNVLLARQHAAVITELARNHAADMAISDKFGKADHLEKALKEVGCRIELKQIVRGESIPQVAAASIIARACFLREMATLSDRAGIELPRGAGSPVDQAGRKLVGRFGPPILDDFAKTHFKNYARALAIRAL